MLTILRDASGRIEAACEWTPVNAQGTPSNDYTWVWVNQLDLSAGIQRERVIRELMELIGLEAPRARGAYWHRRDKTGERIHSYVRRQLVQEEVRVR